MSTYLFILGKHRNLSLAELVAKYPKGDFQVIGPDFAVMDIDEEMTQETFNKLGSIIKVAKFISRSSNKGLNQKLIDEISGRFESAKVEYGLSIYGSSQKELKPMLMHLKKSLIKEGVKSRFINKDFKNISSAQYKSFKKDGVEIVLLRDQNFYWMGEVVAVQDIDSYSERDFKKPYRSMQVGMLPPKLAQILINLSSQKGRVWDPFCGGGVLVMEGVLMGRDMLGSDINAETLKGAEKNLKWTKETLKGAGDYKLFEHDATKVMKSEDYDAIAAEGYLGPPQNKPVSPEEAKAIIEELNALYVDYFKALKEADFKGPIVMALPYFKLNNKKEMDLRETISQIEGLGFKRVAFLPGLPDIKDPYMLKYSRADQAVGRAIYKFQL